MKAKYFSSCVPRRRLTLVGLKSGVFYGPDGSEAALNSLKKHDGRLFVGLPKDETLGAHPPEGHQRLQPIKEIEKFNWGEFYPPIQAAVIEKRDVVALDRKFGINMTRVSHVALTHPLEALKTYKHIGLRSYHKMKKDDDLRAHFQLNFPHCSKVFFEERAELIAVALLARFGEEDATCIVPQHLYPLVEEFIEKHKDLPRAELSKREEDLSIAPRHVEGLVSVLYYCIPMYLVYKGMQGVSTVMDGVLMKDTENRD